MSDSKNNPNNSFFYKEADAVGKELFSMLIYRRVAHFLLEKIFKNTALTPNQISYISLFLALAAAYCFFLNTYPFFLLAVLLLQLTYAFDMLDGMMARYKNMGSDFGRWLDPMLDCIKVVALFFSISYGFYVHRAEARALIFGMLAMGHSLLTFFILNTKHVVIKETAFEVRLKGNIYVGYEIMLYLMISFFAVINQLYLGLVFLATVGAFSWIKLFASVARHNRRVKA